MNARDLPGPGNFVTNHTIAAKFSHSPIDLTPTLP